MTKNEQGSTNSSKAPTKKWSILVVGGPPPRRIVQEALKALQKPKGS